VIGLAVVYFVLGIVFNPKQTEAGDAAVKQHIETHLNIYMVPV
jgi:hypothetical protein